MKRTLAIVAAVAAVGCGGKVYEIHDANAKKVKGVPFYRMSGNCTQETVYLETVYRIVIQAPATDKTPAAVVLEKVIPGSAYTSDTMKGLREAVIEGQSNFATIRKLFNSLATYAYKDPPDKNELVLLANVNKPGTHVDYGQVHYINVERPWAGSASATAKLNADGTLSEVAAEVEDKTLETVLSSIPVSELLLGVVAGGGTGPLSAGFPAGGGAVQLIATPSRVRHTLTKTEEGTGICPALTKIEIDATNANRRRDVISESSPVGEENDNAIGVTGKITLPKKGGQ